jgi:hypothetical protein
MSSPERAGSSCNRSAVWPAAAVLGGDVFLSDLRADDTGPSLVLAAIAPTLDLHDAGMVQEPVEHGGGEHAIAGEGLVRGTEAEVRGHDRRALLVTRRDDLEE